MEPAQPTADPSPDGVDLVVDLFAALESGDFEAALAMIHPAMKLSTCGPGDRRAGTGRAAAKRLFEEHESERVRVESGNVFSLGGWIVALGTVGGLGAGSGATSPVGWNMRVREQKVFEARGYASWIEALDAAGGWSAQPG